MDTNRVEMSLWRDLKAHILSGSPGPVPPKISCVVCQDYEIIINGLHSYEFLSSNLGGDWEYLCVLPCGHMLGDECLRGLISSTSQEPVDEDGFPPPLRCPVCRFELIFKPCGHKIDPCQLAMAVISREMKARMTQAGQTQSKKARLEHIVRDDMPLTTTEDAYRDLVCSKCFEPNPDTRIEGDMEDLFSSMRRKAPGFDLETRVNTDGSWLTESELESLQNDLNYDSQFWKMVRYFETAEVCSESWKSTFGFNLPEIESLVEADDE